MSRWVVILLIALGGLLGGEAFYIALTQPTSIKVAIHNDEKTQTPPVMDENHRLSAMKRVSVKSADTHRNVSVDVEAIPMPPRMLPSSPDDIKVGMSKDQLRALGEPFVQTATTDHGQLLEVYVYPGNEEGNVTVAQLKDGVVVSAYARAH